MMSHGLSKKFWIVIIVAAVIAAIATLYLKFKPKPESAFERLGCATEQELSYDCDKAAHSLIK